MFSGCYIHSVDNKNRISIPAKFRKMLANGFVLTKGPDGCLWVLSNEQWNTVLTKAAKSVTIQRFFLASAEQCLLEPKGRCVLPDTLRKHADVRAGDEVAIVGLANRIEIWSAHRWEAVNSQLTSDRLMQELPEFFGTVDSGEWKVES